MLVSQVFDIAIIIFILSQVHTVQKVLPNPMPVLPEHLVQRRVCIMNPAVPSVSQDSTVKAMVYQTQKVSWYQPKTTYCNMVVLTDLFQIHVLQTIVFHIEFKRVKYWYKYITAEHGTMLDTNIQIKFILKFFTLGLVLLNKIMFPILTSLTF